MLCLPIYHPHPPHDRVCMPTAPYSLYFRIVTQFYVLILLILLDGGTSVAPLCEISVILFLFSQFQQMLMHRAQKRMQNSLSLHEISPHLAAISSSCITMPGHNQGDEVSEKKGSNLRLSVIFRYCPCTVINL